MNVEATEAAMAELTTNFRYNDAVLRNLVIRTNEAVTEESPILKAEKESRERKPRPDRPERRERREESTAEAPKEAPAKQETAADAAESKAGEE